MITPSNVQHSTLKRLWWPVRLVVLIAALSLPHVAVAQVSVDVAANPSPFTPGSSVYVTVSASWPLTYYECGAWSELCNPAYVTMSACNSTGTCWFDEHEIYWWTGGDWWGFSDSPNDSTNYSVSVTVWYRDREMGWWIGSYSGSGSAYVQAGPPARPQISGQGEMWWFNGAAPRYYNNTVISLSADSGESTQWQVTRGGSRVQLLGNQGSQVEVLAIGGSSALEDVEVTASANGQTSEPHRITVYRPDRLVPHARVDQCHPIFGYQSDVDYWVRDQFNRDLPASVEANEKWASDIRRSWPGNNWSRGPEINGMTDGALLLDSIAGDDVGYANPVPGCPPSRRDTPVVEWDQEFRIGNTNTGYGVLVQRNVFLKRLDFAEHVFR